MKSLLILGALFSCAVFAQEDTAPSDGYQSTIEDFSAKKENTWTWKSATKVIKMNPFELMSAVPTIAADFELKLPGGFVSLQTGMGLTPDYLQPMSGSTDAQFSQMNGYNLRLEPRFFLFTGKHHYLSAEIYFRHLIIKDEIPVGMEGTTDEWGTPTYAYFINTDMLFHRFNSRLNLKYGVQHIFKNGFVLETYTGLSLRKTVVLSNSDFPDGGEPQGGRNGFEWNLVDGHTNQYFTPVFGVKLGFAVKH